MKIEGKIEQAANILRQSRHVIALTGAGISTPSGIPDFRSLESGIWEFVDPFQVSSIFAFRQHPQSFFDWMRPLAHTILNAEPNPAHISIVKLYDMGLLESVITQNIDGLHQKAGLPDEKVIELHGNTCRVRCMCCSKIISIHEAQNRIEAGDLAPECECGGYLKPDTISFGQAMPKEEVEKATELSLNCDFFIVVGSTLQISFPVSS